MTRSVPLLLCREKTVADLSKAERIAAVWDEVMDESFWSEMSDDDLYSLQVVLWAAHQDALMEWTRRQMRAADPKR